LEIEKEWGGNTFWSFGTSTESKGTAILIKPGLNCKINSFKHDHIGRNIILDVSLNNIELRLISVYAPNNVKERKDFFKSLQIHLMSKKYVILAGDFNCVENVNLDKLGGNRNYGNQGAEILLDIKQNFDMLEAFRHLYPTQKEYSWFAEGKNIAERLDRFYVSSNLEVYLESVNHRKFNMSDHSLVSLQFKQELNDQQVYGKGYWKCNTSVLEKEEFLIEFVQLWEWLKSKNEEMGHTIQWWELCKDQFKELITKQSKMHAIQFAKQFQDLENRLQMYRVLEDIEPGNFDIEIEQIQKEIDTLLQHKITGAIIRSKAKVLDANEKPTKYFLRKEHDRGKSKTISVLETEKGKIEDPKSIVEECKDFYANLYKEENVDQSLIDYFLKEVPKLPEIDRDSCEGLLSVEECLISINKMENGKSPGMDGLPKEFYSKVFHIIGKDFVKVMNNIYIEGNMAPSQKKGLITLICKDKNKSEQLTNWRPISLLNVDYKIVSKAMTNRLSGVIDKLIHIDQTCAVPGRSIQDNVHLLRNIIDYTDQKETPCAFISLDQSKAFDRVSHDYLFQTLKAYGFGPDFIKWVQLLYTDINSSVLVNGFISESFQVQRSVRQGCSLSPLLYVLSIEPFAIKIRQDENIKGLKLPGYNDETKISQYADDTTGIVVTTQSIAKFLLISELYSLASGAKLNKNKSCAIWLGSWKHNNDKLYGLNWVESIKICGVHFGTKNMAKNNWEPTLAKISKTVNLYQSRSVSMYGKAVISNVSICSKLWYLVATTILPAPFLDKIIRLVFDFVWSNKTEKVSRNTMYLESDKGGIGLVHIKSKIKAMQVKHLLQLLNKEYAKWHSFAIYWIGFSLRSFKPEYASNSIPHSDHKPMFYEASCECFTEFLELCKTSKKPIPKDQMLTLTTKEIYTLFLQAQNKTHVPRMYTVHPNVNYNLAFGNNLSDMLSPAQKNLTWQILHNIVPVQLLLNRFKISNTKACPHCGRIETVIHAFYQCPIVQPLWNKIVVEFGLLGLIFPNALLDQAGAIDMKIAVFNLFPKDSVNQEKGKLFLLFVSQLRNDIWYNRCAKLKEKKSTDTETIFFEFKGSIKSRLRLDHYRMKENKFTQTWVQGLNLLEIIDNRLVFNF